MIPRTPKATESVAVPAVDPMADIPTIVDDAVLAGLDPRRLAFASVYMRFVARAPWEAAAAAARPSWEVASYSSGQGHMLRLSRKAHPTPRDLAELRADAVRFANAHGADWLSMSIEDPRRAPSEWARITAPEQIRLPEQPSSPDIENDVQVQRLQRGGTA